MDKSVSNPKVTQPLLLFSCYIICCAVFQFKEGGGGGGGEEHKY